MADEGGSVLFGARFQDDISATSRAAATSLRSLNADVKQLGEAFQRSTQANNALNVSLRDAKEMFKSAGSNLTILRSALKDCGTSALDTRLIVGQLTKELTASRKEALGFGEALGSAKGHGHGFVTTLGDALHVVKELAHALAKPFEMLWEFGDKAQEAFAERMNTLRAYTALLGDASKAQQEFAWAQGFAKKSSFTQSQVVDTQRRMLASGMTTEQARAGTAGIMDIATLKGGPEGARAMQLGGHMFAEIGEIGMRKQVLNALSRDFGLSESRIFKEMAKLVGAKGGDEEIMKRMKKGEWASEEGGRLGQLAVLNAIKNLVGEKQLGQFAMGGANTLETALINQKEAVKNLLQTFDSELLPGVRDYKRSLQEQAQALDSNTERGNEMSRTLQYLANTSVEAKSVWTDFTTEFMKAFSESFNAATGEVGKADNSMSGLRDTFSRAGQVIGGLGGPVGTLLSGFEAMTPVVTVLSTVITTAVKAIGFFGEFIGNMAGFIVETIHNPSKWRENLGMIATQQADWTAGALVDIGVAAGLTSKTALAHGKAAGVTAAQETTAVFGEHGKGKKHGKGGGSGSGGTTGDFTPGDWSIAGSGAWAPGAEGASPWGTADAYAATAERQVSAGVAAQRASGSDLRTVAVGGVTIVVEGATGEEVAEKIAEVLRGMGRNLRNPAPQRV